MLSHLLAAAFAATVLAAPPAAAAPTQRLAPVLGRTPTVDLSKPVTLEQAIDIAVSNHQSLAIARSQAEAASARVQASRASYYPQLSPGYSYSNQVTTQRFNGKVQTGNVEQSITSVDVRQTLFDSFKREENLLASRYSARSAVLQVTDTRQAVVQNVTVAYYELMRRRDLVSVSSVAVERAKTTLDYTQTAADAGSLARKEILQAQADYLNAQVQLLSAKNDVLTAQTALKAAMGVLSPDPVTIPDGQPATPAAEADTHTAGEYVAQALQNRADLRGQAESINAGRHNVKVAQINAGLQLSADVSEGYRVDPDPGENRTFSVGVSYPLFDAGAARAAVREARANLEQTRQNLELNRQNVQTEVEQAYLNREQARQRIAATQAAVKAARLNYEAALGARQEGAETGTVLDIITAESQLVTAEVNAVQAVYDYYVNDARLKRAVGSPEAPAVRGTK